MEPLAEASYEVTPEDRIAVVKRQMRSLPMIEAAFRRNRRNAVMTALFLTAMCGVCGYVSGARSGLSVPLATTAAVVMLVISGTYWALCLTKRALWQRIDAGIERGVRSGEMEGPVSGMFHVALLPDCAATTQSGTAISWDWAPEVSVVDAEDAVYLDFPRRGTIRVARRAFTNDAERGRFVRVAEGLARGGGRV